MLCVYTHKTTFCLYFYIPWACLIQLHWTLHTEHDYTQHWVQHTDFGILIQASFTFMHKNYRKKHCSVTWGGEHELLTIISSTWSQNHPIYLLDPQHCETTILTARALSAGVVRNLWNYKWNECLVLRQGKREEAALCWHRTLKPQTGLRFTIPLWPTFHLHISNWNSTSPASGIPPLMLSPSCYPWSVLSAVTHENMLNTTPSWNLFGVSWFRSPKQGTGHESLLQK